MPDPVSVTSRTHLPPAFTLARRRGDRHRARPVFDRLGGIERQIHNELLHLRAVGLDWRQIAREVRPHLHQLRDRVAQQGHDLAHLRRKVHRLHVETALPGIRQHLADEESGAVAGLQDFIKSRV